MVISAGENIYCAEVERVLLAHPGLAEATAFGVPDARLGERLGGDRRAARLGRADPAR
jgi:acyl-CoA synthetase (AMP-forming)/AMP-acid ligase II